MSAPQVHLPLPTEHLRGQADERVSHPGRSPLVVLAYEQGSTARAPRGSRGSTPDRSAGRLHSTLNLPLLHHRVAHPYDAGKRRRPRQAHHLWTHEPRCTVPDQLARRSVQTAPAATCVSSTAVASLPPVPSPRPPPRPPSPPPFLSQTSRPAPPRPPSACPTPRVAPASVRRYATHRLATDVAPENIGKSSTS